MSGARRLAVISPHLDDGVLGCGQLLAARPGAVVVTLFAGRPDPRAPLTPWDAAAGFRAGDDVVGTRRAEDAAALRALGARPAWLDHRDAQYGGAAPAETLARCLAQALEAAAPDVVAAPLGLFHSDHLRAREAALLARERSCVEARWLLYADGAYAALPGAVRGALAELRARGVALRRARLAGGPLARKRRAVACYASQVRALATPGRLGVAPALRPERYWWIEP